MVQFHQDGGNLLDTLDHQESNVLGIRFFSPVIKRREQIPRQIIRHEKEGDYGLRAIDRMHAENGHDEKRNMKKIIILQAI